jgi:transcriptional regulator with XRE-family HTH domain
MTAPSKARAERDVQVSRIVAHNVQLLRQAQRMSLRGLAATIQANGHRMNYSSMSRIELGCHSSGSLRPVTVDELCHLAEALGVTPGQLLNPPNCPACLDHPGPHLSCNLCGAGKRDAGDSRSTTADKDH